MGVGYPQLRQKLSYHEFLWFHRILIVFNINYINVNGSELQKRRSFGEGGGGAATLFQIKYYKELVHKSLMLLSTETKIKWQVCWIRLSFLKPEVNLSVINMSIHDRFMHTVSLQESRHSHNTTQSRVVMLVKLWSERHTGGCDWRGKPRRRAG